MSLEPATLPVRPASAAGCLLALLLATAAGCRQNPAGGTTGSWSFPWQRQAQTADALQQQSSYLGDLIRRAEQQAQLSRDQQRQLANLRQLQRQTDQQAQALRQQQLQMQSRGQQQLAQQAQQQQQALGQWGDLQRQASSLDTVNRDLHQQLARSDQQVQLLQDQLNLMRQRLAETAEQLVQTQQARQQSDQQMQLLNTATRPRAGATISANNSLQQGLTAVSIPGMEVRQDGDLVRIELPADQLFLPGTATLHQGAIPLIDQAVQAVSQNYPRQLIGIEAHSDPDPTTGTAWRNKHQLTAAQAMAVFEQFTQRHSLRSEQVFVLGHGPNHPLASNATPAGKARNRRIEIVIYPEAYRPL